MSASVLLSMFADPNDCNILKQFWKSKFRNKYETS